MRLIRAAYGLSMFLINYIISLASELLGVGTPRYLTLCGRKCHLHDTFLLTEKENPMKRFTLLTFILMTSSVYAQQPAFSMHLGAGGFVNIGGTFGIGFESRWNHLAVNASVGTLVWEVPKRAGKENLRYDLNIGTTYYFSLKTFRPHVGVSYGLVDYEYTGAEQPNYFNKIRDLSFSIGIRGVYRRIYCDPYFAILPSIISNESGAVRDGFSKVPMTFGILLGYEF